MEKRYFHKSGRLVWILLSVCLVRDERGEPQYFIAQIQDITERKRTEAALREREAQLCDAHRMAQIGSWSWFPETERSVWSDQMFSIFAIDPNRQPCRYPDMLRFLSPSASIHMDEAVQKSLITGEAYSVEVEIVRPDGSHRWAVARGAAIPDEHGRVFELKGTIQDIDDRVLLEQQLRQAQKMEAIGRLAGGVAHDFNNLVMIINGHSELLLKKLSAWDPMAEGLMEIRKAGGKAASLTQQLLAFSRKQVVQPKVVDLNEVVRDTVDMLGRLVGEDINVVATLGAQAAYVMADPDQIAQVLMNLAVNSRDAMPSGGQLTIETANSYLDEGYSRDQPDMKPGPHVYLTVSDSGIGMDENVRGHLFEPFFTTKPSGEGTGLGLATVYGIVKQAGGSIDVESEPGKGATFKIFLPQIEGSEPPRKEADRVADTLQGTETILLVDDQAELRKLVEMILRSHGYKVLVAANAGEALLHAERYAGRIHLLLTDVVMPGVGGKELADRLQPLRPDMKILYTSGYAENIIVHRGVLEEGVPFLQKPSSPEQLSLKVREVLDEPRANGIASGE